MYRYFYMSSVGLAQTFRADITIKSAAAGDTTRLPPGASSIVKLKKLLAVV